MSLKTKQLLIVGCGETAHLAYEYFTHDSCYEVVAFTVHAEYMQGNDFCGLPVVPYEDIEKLYSPSEYDAFVAVASGQLNRQRTFLYLATKKKGYCMASYVSSHAFIWHNVDIGENCFILENNTLQPFTKIGNNVTLWGGSQISHRTIIKDNCFIAPGVVIAGFCVIGENCFIGVNAAVGDFVQIAEDNFIAMGSIIYKSTEVNKVYKGNPAVFGSIAAKSFCNVRED